MIEKPILPPGVLPPEVGESDQDGAVRVEEDRTGMDVPTLRRAFMDHLLFSQGTEFIRATAHDQFMALALTVRDRLLLRRRLTRYAHRLSGAKRVYYLSAEFLMGGALANNLINVGLYQRCREALADLGLALEDLLEVEVDPGLGNGGLGRLAACFLDSLATLGYPGMGYGIRYEFGIFDQEIRDGYQVERPDEWLRFGNPWEYRRPEFITTVKFYGRIEEFVDTTGSLTVRWIDTQNVLGLPFDTLIAGYGNNTVNCLRLWSARASEEFDLQVFNDGQYLKAVQQKSLSESIAKVLYPKDDSPEGKELRLKQEYFFVSCSLQDILRRFGEDHQRDGRPAFDLFADKVAIQLNDTHPALAIPELMRLLVDEHGLSWEAAWEQTQRTFAYTNHTLLAEALETWPVALFEKLLPRHLQIIYEINRRFLRLVQIKYPWDDARPARMSLIEEGPERKVRMAHLAVVGSHSVNGVSEIHTELVKRELLPDFYELWPERFTNKTNGVTPRRWLLQSNPRLAEAITARIGPGWITHLDDLRRLAPLADDPEFRAEIRAIKRANKQDLSDYLLREQANSLQSIPLDVDSLFDVQVKRIHEYKRQLLKALHILGLYVRAKQDRSAIRVPRTFLIGGKAAPGYTMAKLIIKLINSVADVVNQDPDVRGLLRVIFLQNYRVSLAERIFPAADLSEQISTAGKEASGTGNMKFGLNGAVTIGTLDGANVEIREEVGAENFFLFGLTVEEIAALKRTGYNPRAYYEADPELKAIIDLIASDFLEPAVPGLFQPIVDSLLTVDRYFLLADYASYVACQEQVAEAYQDPERWARLSILNIAGMGRFSSDRAIRQYAEEIWRIEPVPVKL